MYSRLRDPWVWSDVGLLAFASTGGVANGLLRGSHERLGLVDRLLVLGLGLAVGDDAAAGLDVHDAVLDDGCPEHDAGVHGPVGGEIAHRASIGASAFFLLELVNEFHGADFRGAGGRSGG